MACFFCPVNNARQCGGSCGLCGTRCPGFEVDSTSHLAPRTSDLEGIPNGMKAEDYDTTPV